jgi:hypothetical protein
MGRMASSSDRMHVDTSRRRYTATDGSVTIYERHLLRRSFRDQNGRPQKETLANLSMLPGPAVEALKKALSGASLVDIDDAFDIERALPHGDVAAVHVMASKLGIKDLLGPAGRDRDLAYALIVSRVVRPRSKLSTIGWWDDVTLGVDLQVAGAGTDEVYAAMDWLAGRQDAIEAALAKRHLRDGGMALFDLSSSWLEGRKCDLAAFGHSRDAKRGRKQIEYGLLTDVVGRPVGIRVFPGNTSDTTAFKEAVVMVREKFKLDRVVMVGDRGMITNARVKELRDLEGMEWITALRAPQIAALARDDGPLQMSLFDIQNFAEISHPDYPGERLVCCHNPALADERGRRRAELLAATERALDTLVTRVEKGRLHGSDEIGLAAGKIVNKHKVAKHFVLDITDDTLGFRRDQEKIDAEASLDGIYVIRTSVPEEVLGSGGVIAAYKSLAHVERDFRNIKVDDLDLRPVFHYLADRVRVHVLICMLAAYVVWHMREALAELTFTDEHIPQREDPVVAAQRSDTARGKDASKRTPDGIPVRSFRDLLDHLRTLSRDVVTFAGRRFDKMSMPTRTQRRVFELLGAPIPVTLT